MPTVNINAEALFRSLGRRYTEDEFADLCFEYGLELDEVTSVKKQLEKQHGKSAGGDPGTESPEDTIYKIDIPANRYDLLCLEGLTRSLLIFLGKIPIPRYTAVTPVSPIEVTIDVSVQKVRPVFIGAVLRNVTFTKEVYDSFIDLQDKLHNNIGRKRKLVSIGTHDLDTLTPPFTYEARRREDIKFVPLNQTREFGAQELLEFYGKDTHLKPYVQIVEDFDVLPVVRDSENVIGSLPPIINSEHSKITLKTKNIFIDITATDEHKASITLDTIVTMFGEHCADKFKVEQVKIIKTDGTRELYPKLPYHKIKLQPSRVNELLGTELGANRIAELLTKMSLKTKVKSGALLIDVPPTRHDIIHPVDVIEDVGIAHGYNNIEMKMPATVTTASQLPVNKLTDQLRESLAQSGFTEVLTFSLCSTEDISKKLRKANGHENAVKVSNPKTLEFQVARTQLLPGVLKTIGSNKKMPLPLRLFEISDIVVKCAESDTKARNERNLCAVYYGKTSGFEVIHGLLDRIMCLLRVPHVTQSKAKPSYEIRQTEDETFFRGRCAEILIGGKRIGVLGVVHPNVLTNFDLNIPVAALELCIETFI
ncbi:phenylalanine--tRNA ligase beta subunit [Galendromus occidentalis]|uniref:Phenylalanine--tRNA ligase beta subunit n=1 Tax=Galendromus occidentalis TaxID=34638 RepID=A0AAJ6VZ36_9ACAR|nr:phenylalanine--tRNA ligase beta subunit [Galendromus occidentalis]